MQIAVIYHSCSGNTKLVALRIARGLETLGARCETLDIASNRAAGVSFNDFDAVGFGFPVQAWKPTPAMAAYVKNLPPQSNKPAFLFCSNGGMPSNSLSLLADAMIERGFRPLLGHSVCAEDDWPITRALLGAKLKAGRPNAEDIRSIDRFTKEAFSLLDRALRGDPVPQPQFPFKRDWMHYVGRAVTPNRLRSATGRKRVETERCTRCGLCAKGCPSQAIRLDPYPVFSDACDGCWGCYNTCPQKAIDSSLLLGRNGRYAGPDWSILDQPWPLP